MRVLAIYKRGFDFPVIQGFRYENRRMEMDGILQLRRAVPAVHQRGQRFTKGIVQLVFGIPVERFYNSSPIAVLFVHAVQKDAFKQRFQGYILFALYNFRKRSYACLLVYA